MSHFRHSPHTVQVPSLHAELVILRGRAKNRSRRICVPAFLIGGADDCDLVLGDSQYPDVYACILLRKDGVWLRHLGFDPEITVNGIVATRTKLENGDRIRTGPYEFRVRIHGHAEGDGPDTGKSPQVATAPSIASVVADPDHVAKADVRRLVAVIRSEVLAEEVTVRLYRAADNPSSAARLPARAVPVARPA